MAKKEQMTPEQKKVVQVRGRDLLVAAAAGSGKTWVLVKRIIARMKEERLDITAFLLVTFTKAAAAEMRERFTKAIEAEQEALLLMEHTDAEALAYWNRQESLVYQAQICTIDSFCADIVKQYFMHIEVDPNYRIAEEGELKILRSEVMDALLEEEYEKQDEDFLHLVECYAPGRNDRKIAELVLRLTEFQMSHANPDQWILHAKAQIKDISYYTKELCYHIGQMLAPACLDAKEAGEIAQQEDGEKVRALLQEEYDLLCRMREMAEQSEIEALEARLKQPGFQTLRFPKEYDEESKEQIKAYREHYKKIVKQLKESFFKVPYETPCSDLLAMAPVVETLLELSRTFRIRYQERKRKEAVADFSDVEHMALDILTELDEQGIRHPSAIAQKLKEEYAEIMIDEYQDSNYLQEAILSSFADHNMFMVGDMKQSIYRFRMAEPRLFVDKYETFATYDEELSDEVQQVKVELDRNFRSSSNVLESINYLFYRLMHRSIGDVEYDLAASLKAGADYTPPKKETCVPGARYDNVTELLIYDRKQQQEETEEDTEDKVTAEARMIAFRIKQMLDPAHPMLVKMGEDEETKRPLYRPATYRDMVVLLRSPSASAAAFAEVFAQEGIPAYVERTKGYFEAAEIELMLLYLNILVNSRDDIAVTACLYQFFGGLKAQELALIFAECREQGFSDRLKEAGIFADLTTVFGKCKAWLAAREQGILTDPLDGVDMVSLQQRLQHFYAEYEQYEAYSQVMTVSKLLQTIYEKSGYLRYQSALPAGERRVANLMMLVTKATQYEALGKRSVFPFLRYIEKMKSYDVDFGEANLLSENENVVRIMSIHKSKGLEFPIVFVSQLSKQFNEMDQKSDLLLSAERGVGTGYIDPVLRIKRSTIARNMMAVEGKRAMLGEELRVLYVALSRAKDKCILTAVSKDLLTQLAALPGKMDYAGLYSSKNYLEWILSALRAHPVLREKLQEAGVKVQEEKDEYPDCEAAFALSCFDQNDLKSVRQERIADTLIQKEQLEERAQALSREELETLKERMQEHYAHSDAVTQVGKYSVSQIKAQNSTPAAGGHHSHFEPTLPQFMKKDQEGGVTGAMRGTYIHKFMERYDFTKGYDDAEYETVAQWMQTHQYPGIYEAFSRQELKTFFESELAQQMVAAAKKGRLYKEAQFVVGFPAEEVTKDMDVICQEEDLLLVQGIIDAYYETDEGNLVIMDYKTDQVTDPDTLEERYQMQLAYYQKTLEQITEKEVAHRMIYSFALGVQIDLK